jgi:hypothetical protein
MQIKIGRFEILAGPGLYVCVPRVGSVYLGGSFGVVWSSWKDHKAG